MPTTWIYARSVGQSRCRDTTCRRAIEWGELVDSKKRMPFDAPIVVLRTQRTYDGVILWEVDLSTNHFATCPAADRFRKPPRERLPYSDDE